MEEFAARVIDIPSYADVHGEGRCITPRRCAFLDANAPRVSAGGGGGRCGGRYGAVRRVVAAPAVPYPTAATPPTAGIPSVGQFGYRIPIDYEAIAVVVEPPVAYCIVTLPIQRRARRHF